MSANRMGREGEPLVGGPSLHRQRQFTLLYCGMFSVRMRLGRSPHCIFDLPAEQPSVNFLVPILQPRVVAIRSALQQRVLLDRQAKDACIDAPLGALWSFLH